MSDTGQQVAIITGASQGIGAALVDGYRQRRWAVVANSLTIKPSQDPDVLTVKGDISEQATADQIITQAMDRFGRVDTVVNNARGSSYPNHSPTTQRRTTRWLPASTSPDSSG
jgi:NAD(P)-dependent dehydrogenase (short-subunit alcohol dehydrogenase family)